MSYGDYRHLDAVLNVQQPLSPDHNEMLFIIQYQTRELWMKLMRHEWGAAIRCVAGDELGSAFKMLARVSKIMEQLLPERTGFVVGPVSRTIFFAQRSQPGVLGGPRRCE